MSCPAGYNNEACDFDFCVHCCEGGTPGLESCGGSCGLANCGFCIAASRTRDAERKHATTDSKEVPCPWPIQSQAGRAALFVTDDRRRSHEVYDPIIIGDDDDGEDEEDCRMGELRIS